MQMDSSSSVARAVSAITGMWALVSGSLLTDYLPLASSRSIPTPGLWRRLRRRIHASPVYLPVMWILSELALDPTRPLPASRSMESKVRLATVIGQARTVTTQWADSVESPSLIFQPEGRQGRPPHQRELPPPIWTERRWQPLSFQHKHENSRPFWAGALRPTVRAEALHGPKSSPPRHRIVL
jgi:hypothetical protein